MRVPKLIYLLCITLFHILNGFTQTAIEEKDSILNSFDLSTMSTNYFFNKGIHSIDEIELIESTKMFFSNSESILQAVNAVNKSNTSNSLKDLSFDLIFAQNSDESAVKEMALGMFFLNGEYMTESNMLATAIQNATPIFNNLNLFAAAPSSYNVVGREVIFKWKQENFLQGFDPLYNIEIDYGDGLGYQLLDLTSSSSRTVSYNSIGEKSIDIKLITTDNEEYHSYSTIDVLSLQNYIPTNSEDIELVSMEAIAEDPQVLLWLSGGHYDYFEGNDHKLDKAVIIAEGFDFGSPVRVTAREFYVDNWRALGETMRENGYDVFSLSFRRTGASMTNNAEVVKKLIKGINEKKHGNYDITYIGSSLGGVVGRIALAELEAEGYDHHVGLFTAYDSPMKGANIPLGLQHVALDIDTWSVLASFTTAILGVERKLMSSSPKQAIIRHVEGSSVYNNFQQYLDDLGYPTKSRNISIVNGSNNSNGQGLNINGTILDKTIFNTGFHRTEATAWYSRPNLTHRVSRIYRKRPWPYQNLVKERSEGFNNFDLDNSPGGEYRYNDVRFSFVPVLSSVDIRRDIWDQGNMYRWLDTRAFVLNGTIPFDNVYYVSGQNNSLHVSESFYNDNDDDDKLAVWQRDFLRNEMMIFDLYAQDRVFHDHQDFEASNSANLGNNVDPNSFRKIQNTGDVVLMPGAEISIKAGTEINLEEGFEVRPGATFDASVDESRRRRSRRPQAELRTELRAKIEMKGSLCSDKTFSVLSAAELDITWQLVAGDLVLLEETSEEIEIYNSGLKPGQYVINAVDQINGQIASKTFVIPSKDFCTTVSGQSKGAILQSQENKLFQVYPNPSQGDLQIQTEIQGIIFCQLFSIDGKLIRDMRLKNGEQINSLQKGLYLLKYQNAEASGSVKIKIE